jgi:hypothetical protein
MWMGGFGPPFFWTSLRLWRRRVAAADAPDLPERQRAPLEVARRNIGCAFGTMPVTLVWVMSSRCHPS